MSSIHKQAMEAVLQAADQDIAETLNELGVKDSYSEEADDAILDVAITHAYRIFMRISEHRGLTVDAGLFADMAADLAEDVAQDVDSD